MRKFLTQAPRHRSPTFRAESKISFHPTMLHLLSAEDNYGRANAHGSKLIIPTKHRQSNPTARNVGEGPALVALPRSHNCGVTRSSSESEWAPFKRRKHGYVAG
ncbi:hypothetical protein GW17_00047194 [Ensete ventricosum]|nr:hypothetical protein GW17_00047194 [Ensete ventricosum]